MSPFLISRVWKLKTVNIFDRWRPDKDTLEFENDDYDLCDILEHNLG